MDPNTPFSSSKLVNRVFCVVIKNCSKASLGPGDGGGRCQPVPVVTGCVVRVGGNTR